jgi:predicted nucleotidyltransferase
MGINDKDFEKKVLDLITKNDHNILLSKEDEGNSEVVFSGYDLGTWASVITRAGLALAELELGEEEYMLDFYETVLECYANDEFVSNYNRLTGSELKVNKTTIENMIDEATGVTKEQLEKFVEFVYEYMYLRVS